VTGASLAWLEVRHKEMPMNNDTQGRLWHASETNFPQV